MGRLPAPRNPVGLAVGGLRTDVEIGQWMGQGQAGECRRDVSRRWLWEVRECRAEEPGKRYAERGNM